VESEPQLEYDTGMQKADRIFGWLMALGGVGHGFGSWQAYHAQPMELLWALAASFAVFLLSALNLLRAGRKRDGAVAWVSFTGCLVWAGFVIWFGVLIGNVLDFRPLVHLVTTLVLAGFSLRSALAARS
jgi:hypothetical protein